MCERAEVDVRVKVPADLSSTGEEKWRDFGIDACIAPIVAALQAGGIDMRGSCCGHGREPGSILLADGRTLAIRTPVRKVTRPRVLTDEYGCEWRFAMGYVAWRGLGQTEWASKLSTETLSLTINANRAAIIASLFANATEEVDE